MDAIRHERASFRTFFVAAVINPRLDSEFAGLSVVHSARLDVGCRGRCAGFHGTDSSFWRSRPATALRVAASVGHSFQTRGELPGLLDLDKPQGFEPVASLVCDPAPMHGSGLPKSGATGSSVAQISSITCPSSTVGRSSEAA